LCNIISLTRNSHGIEGSTNREDKQRGQTERTNREDKQRGQTERTNRENTRESTRESTREKTNRVNHARKYRLLGEDLQM
jgi:hypothetical protein